MTPLPRARAADMKSPLRLLAAAAALFVLGGCASLGPVVTGSGDIVAYSVGIDNFDRIEAGNCVRVEAAYGAAYSVTVNADDNLRSYIEVFRRDDALVVRMKNGYSYSRCTVRVVVAMPALESLAASDAAEARIAGFASAGTVFLSAFDASSISGGLICGSLVLSLGDASEAALEGSATDLDLSMNDASKADLLYLPAATARVSLSDACSARVTVSSSISGSLSDASVLRYTGSPSSVAVSTRDGSSLIRD
jgi:hypothetical protein